MGAKTLDELLEDAEKASGESSTNLPTLKEAGDKVCGEVVQVLREERYKTPGVFQTNIVVQVASGFAGGEPIPPGRYKVYLGSASLTHIADTYGFCPGDKVALVLKREIATGKGSPMKDFSVEIIDARGRDVKRNLALQLERRAVPVAPMSPAVASAAPGESKDGIPF